MRGRPRAVRVNHAHQYVVVCSCGFETNPLPGDAALAIRGAHQWQAHKRAPAVTVILNFATGAVATEEVPV